MEAPSPPFLVSWNLTRRCNLRCPHCYLDSSELDGAADPIDTQRAMAVVDELASLSPGAMLVLTGGEPLLRGDIFDIAGHAAQRGLFTALGTNGTMLTDDTVKRLSASGVRGVGVSIDSLSREYHDRFRGLDGAWDGAVSGIGRLSSAAIPFQLQFTVTADNRGELAAMARFAAERGARAVNFFFLVCTGRGERSTDISPLEYEEALTEIAALEREYEGRVMVRARCAPHIIRVASSKGSQMERGATSGCIAGSGYMRISPEGFITPCPYIPPDAGTPRLGEWGLRRAWEEGAAFRALRAPSLKGRCAECEHADGCGGCRARALASKGDLMAEDPWCTYEPGGREKPAASIQPAWSSEAQERLARVPPFLRPMIKKGLERYAAANGIGVITAELMIEMKRKAGV